MKEHLSIDTALVIGVVAIWAAIMIGPYRALRGNRWDVELAGTAAEWTAGLFTGLAVLLAIRTFQHDRQRQAADDAQALISGVTAFPHTNDDGSIDFLIQNESTAPIWDVELYASTISIGANNVIETLLSAGATLWKGFQLLPGAGVRVTYIAAQNSSDNWSTDRKRSITTTLLFTDSARNRWLDNNGKREIIETNAVIHPGVRMPGEE